MQRCSRRGSWALRLALLGAVVAAAASTAAGAASPQLTLRLTLQVDRTRNVYTEGAYYYVAVRGLTRRFRATQRFRQGQVTFRLRPGKYSVRAYARPCDGNCAHLDPPTDRCAARYTFQAVRKTWFGTARFRAGSHCRLRLFKFRTV